MKKVLRLLIIVFSIAVLFCVLFIFSRTGNIENLSVVFYSNNSKQQVKWYFNEIDDKWYLFLPSEADESNLLLSFLSPLKVTVNGSEIHTNERTNVFKELGEFELKCGRDTYRLVVMKDTVSKIPSVFINTSSGSLDNIYKSKNNKESADIATFVGDKLEIKELEYIKGRGNVTWDVLAQKPYNIKFKEKTDFMGLGEEFRFALLSEYNHFSQVLNSSVYLLAKDMGIPYTTSTKFINLYINGIYQGIYLAAENVEVGKTRVDINDLENENKKANPNLKFNNLMFVDNYVTRYYLMDNNPEDISGGYLIEIELRERYDANDKAGFISEYDTPVNLIAPAHPSLNEILYIKDLFERYEEAIMSKDGCNSKGEHYSDIVDIDSLVNMYILQEFVMNQDSGIVSFYYYKDKGSNKLVAAPAWDFDTVFGLQARTRNGINFNSPFYWEARYGTHAVGNYSPYFLKNVFYYICQHEEFMELVNKRWLEVRPLINNFKSYVSNAFEKEKYSIDMDDIIECGLIQNYDEIRDNLENNIAERIDYLDKGFSDASVVGIEYICDYNCNQTIQHDILVEGDKAVIRDCYYDDYESKDYEFIYWVDKNDNIYYPGDEIIVSKDTIILYAVYK